MEDAGAAAVVLHSFEEHISKDPAINGHAFRLAYVSSDRPTLRKNARHLQRKYGGKLSLLVRSRSRLPSASTRSQQERTAKRNPIVQLFLERPARRGRRCRDPAASLSGLRAWMRTVCPSSAAAQTEQYGIEQLGLDISKYGDYSRFLPQLPQDRSIR